ncbi:MAG: response regulator [Deferrisomatales bacterium]|nr:response regulator [Deferrisomatales bacterium]
MPKKLLVVDDSSTILEAVRYALTGEGWAVSAVSSTEEALTALEEELPDAVLCDVSLGEGDDGYEACRTLHAALGGAEVPVILMGRTVSEELAASAGAAVVLSKPFQSHELVDTLEYALQHPALEPREDEGFAIEGLPPSSRALDPTPTASPSPGDVEIIDLSDDELTDVDWLEDLEPLPPAEEPGEDFADLGVGAEEAAAASSGAAWGELEWDPGTAMKDFGSRPAAPGGKDPEVSEPIELPLWDREGAAAVESHAEPSAAEGGAPRSVAEELLQGLGLGPTVSEPGEPDEEDLLGDIDLEGWAEEGRGPAPTPERPLEEVFEARGEPPEEAGERGAGREPFGELELPEDLLGELPPEGEPGESAGTEDSEEGVPWAEVFPSAAGSADEQPQGDPTWAEPQRPPLSSIPWDLEATEPEPIAAQVAEGAADAVRRALEESLSAERLTPLVTAVVEKAVWEVVPPLAERLIREAIEKLQREPPDAA